MQKPTLGAVFGARRVLGWPPQLTFLSVLAHANDTDGLEVLRSLVPALGVLPVETARIYHDLVLQHLSDIRTQEWEAAMAELGREYPFKSEFALKHYGEGIEEGRLSEAATLAKRLLVRRCGMLGPELLAQVDALLLDQLEPLVEAAMDFRGVADLQAWLAAHAS